MELQQTKPGQYGIELYKKGEYDKAVEVFSSLIEKDSKLKEAFFNRSLAYAKLHDHKRSIDDINRFIELDQNNADAYFIRGFIQEQNKDYASAIQDYDKALEIDPNHKKTIERRANLRNCPKCGNEVSIIMADGTDEEGDYNCTIHRCGKCGFLEEKDKTYQNAIYLDLLASLKKGFDAGFPIRDVISMQTEYPQEEVVKTVEKIISEVKNGRSMVDVLSSVQSRWVLLEVVFKCIGYQIRIGGDIPSMIDSLTSITRDDPKYVFADKAISERREESVFSCYLFESRTNVAAGCALTNSLWIANESWLGNLQPINKELIKRAIIDKELSKSLEVHISLNGTAPFKNEYYKLLNALKNNSGDFLKASAEYLLHAGYDTNDLGGILRIIIIEQKLRNISNAKN